MLRKKVSQPKREIKMSRKKPLKTHVLKNNATKMHFSRTKIFMYG